MAQAGGSPGDETFERRAAPAARRGEWGSRRGTERWKWARWRSVSAGARSEAPAEARRRGRSRAGPAASFLPTLARESA